MDGGLLLIAVAIFMFGWLMSWSLGLASDEICKAIRESRTLYLEDEDFDEDEDDCCCDCLDDEPTFVVTCFGKQFGGGRI